MATSKASDGGVVLSRLSKSYGGLRAVDSIDLSIPRGETVAILGPNGAGKSTTLDMVLGLTRPDSGTIALFGMPPARAVAAGQVGGMLQTGSLPANLSVRELLTMIASLYPRPLQVDHVLRLTGAAAFADRRTDKLSGGQTQRARFGIGLIANTDLLVLDEPTAAIDVEGRREFWTEPRRSGWPTNEAGSDPQDQESQKPHTQPSHEAVVLAPFAGVLALSFEGCLPVLVGGDGVRDAGVEGEGVAQPGDLKELQDPAAGGHERQ